MVRSRVRVLVSNLSDTYPFVQQDWDAVQKRAETLLAEVAKA